MASTKILKNICFVLTALFMLSFVVQSVSAEQLATAEPPVPVSDHPKVTNLYYQASWTSFDVGRGHIRIIQSDTHTQVEYRMSIAVKIFGSTAYYVDSHQQAIFTSEGTLLKSQTVADIDGEKSHGNIQLVDDTYVINFDGIKNSVPISDVVFTTLSSLYQNPISGNWLDITDGKLVSYKVSPSQDMFDIERPDGSDILKYNKDGYLKHLKSSIQLGSLVLKESQSLKKEFEENPLADLIPSELHLIPFVNEPQINPQ